MPMLVYNDRKIINQVHLMIWKSLFELEILNNLNLISDILFMKKTIIIILYKYV